MLKLSVTNKRETCPASIGVDGELVDASQRRKSCETGGHSKIKHASTLHNEAVRRWLRVFSPSRPQHATRCVLSS